VTAAAGPAAAGRVVECDMCGRPLTNPRSRARGRGRGCQAKVDAAPMLAGVDTVTVRDGLL